MREGVDPLSSVQGVDDDVDEVLMLRSNINIDIHIIIIHTYWSCVGESVDELAHAHECVCAHARVK